jgi:hypothetical protein
MIRPVAAGDVHAVAAPLTRAETARRDAGHTAAILWTFRDDSGGTSGGRRAWCRSLSRNASCSSP